MNPNSLTGNHIFIIEDDAVMQYIIKRIFSALCTVTVFGDGRSALEALQSGIVPDLIITDLHVPLLNGRQLLFKVRASAEFGHVPVIIMSADNSMNIQFGSLLDGAHDYLTKPFDPKDLINRVSHAIRTASSHLSLQHL